MNSIYKSPGSPPLTPASPLPAILSLLPVSTPLGIVTVRVFSLFTLPLPLQSVHNRSKEVPHFLIKDDTACHLLAYILLFFYLNVNRFSLICFNMCFKFIKRY